MDNFERNDVLKTFRILVDTREHITQSAIKRFDSFEAPLERATLDYGDYAANVTIRGKELYDTSKRVCPQTVVERKQSLDELATCFTRGRDRFRREMERARASGAKIYLLTEGGDWEKIFRHSYRSRFNPNAFIATLTAWMVRYEINVLFCRPGTSGKLIREILYRDIKERLEKGEYG